VNVGTKIAISSEVESAFYIFLARTRTLLAVLLLHRRSFLRGTQVAKNETRCLGAQGGNEIDGEAVGKLEIGVVVFDDSDSDFLRRQI
jgi:hypothetical protein